MRFKKKIFQDKGLFYKTMIDLFDKKMPIEYAEKIELVKRKFNHEQERFLEVKKKLVKRLAGKVNENFFINFLKKCCQNDNILYFCT